MTSCDAILFSFIGALGFACLTFFAGLALRNYRWPKRTWRDDSWLDGPLMPAGSLITGIIVGFVIYNLALPKLTTIVQCGDLPQTKLASLSTGYCW